MYHKMSCFVMIMEVTLLYFINSSYRMVYFKLVFEVSHGVGSSEYVGGEVVVHQESYDPDELSFFVLEDISRVWLQVRRFNVEFS